jgi:hypothetical protein
MLSAFRDAVGRDARALEAAWLDPSEARQGTLDGPTRDALSLDRTRQRLARATDLLAAGDLELSDYQLVRGALQNELDRAQSQQRAAPVCKPLVPLATVLERVPSWSGALESSDTRSQREVLGQLIEQLVVRRPHRGAYRIDISWTPLGAAIREFPRHVSDAHESSHR